VLHSLSGTMAISENTLKDTVLDDGPTEPNKKGGCLGKKLEAVGLTLRLTGALFAEKGRELLTQDKSGVISVAEKRRFPRNRFYLYWKSLNGFGCSTQFNFTKGKRSSLKNVFLNYTRRGAKPTTPFLRWN